MDTPTGPRGVGALLRQLGLGMATYQLYPGDLDQPSFQAAAARIRDAALTTGDVETVIRAGRFHLEGRPIPDDRADHFAAACYAKRVEHLRIVSPPSPTDLHVLYSCLDPDADLGEDGVGGHLAAAGVRSITASLGAPDTTTGDEDPDAGYLSSSAGPQKPDDALDMLSTLRAQSAEELYQTLCALNDTLDEDTSGRSWFFRRAADLAGDLNPSERIAFAVLVFERFDTDAFAERFVGHLSDMEVADVIVAVADVRGKDPTVLATEFAQHSGRQQVLVTLVRNVTRTPTPPAPMVAKESAQGDKRLREAFPIGEAEGRGVASSALADYLRNETRRDQLERVIDAIVAHLRMDLLGGHPDRVADLLATIEDAREHLPSDTAELVASAPAHALTPHVLIELTEATLAGGPQVAASMLRPFGPYAVDALVAALGLEERRSFRGLLVAVLSDLVVDDPLVLGRHLRTPTWYVARNLATVLGRLGGPTVVPLLEQLATHPHPTVRRDTIAALQDLQLPESVSALARVTVRLVERADRRDCLRAIGASGTEDAHRLLRELGSRKAPAPLPWGLRREARSLASRLERVS